MNQRLQNALKRAGKVLALAGCALLAACGSESDQQGPLKIGVIAGPEADLMQVAVEQARSEGLDVELVEFTDYISPNVALSDGSIDLNAFQHGPYLDRMVADRGFKLVAVANTFVYPIGAYSREIKQLDQLSDGAKVAIPNDPSNEGRTLILLHKSGLIELKDINNLEATPRDIVANPKNLKFIELEAAQLPRSLEDVELAFINSTYSVAAGLLPTRDALLVEGKDSPYVNLMVARADNQEDPRIAQLIKAFQTEAVETKALELFKGGALPGWK